MKEKINFKKKFGQNFLTNSNIVNNIVNSVDPNEDNLVIEVGPGAGAMTRFLAMKFDNVLAYEIDIDLKNVLKENLKDYNNVNIIFEDFMIRDVLSDIKEYNAKNIYFMANLPYYITTPIINRLIDLNIDFKNIVVMVQKEVADRFNAKVGTKEYNSLTVFLNYYYNIKKIFNVSRNNFNPAPNVDSAVVMMSSKEKSAYVKDEEILFKLIRDSFKFKRKTLKNNLLGYDLDKVLEVLKRHNFDLNIRAEQISLDLFIEIANNL